MVLHEIVSGMPLAAEKIMENFNMGSIVDFGENDNGHFFVFGNGLQICFPSDRLIVKYYNATILRGEWTLPRPFSNNKFVCIPNAYAFNGSTEVFINSETKVTINATAYGRTLSNSDSITAMPIAVGIAAI